MEIYRDIADLKFDRTVVTVGSFDGVHCGHRALLRRVNDLAAQHNLKSLVLTFSPHPRQILNSEGDVPLLLNTLDERLALLKQTGVDDVLVLPFDRALSQMSASDFVRDIIIKKLNAQYFVVGQDHHFGKGRIGDIQHLLDLSTLNDLRVEVVDLKMTDRKISSSAVRNALLNGDLALANEMLGYEYLISGKVIRGNQIGRTIGFPTANIETPDYKLLPKDGAYRVKVKINTDEFEHTGMMYIGKRPLLKQEAEKIHIEVNIFDFDRQIYGQELAIALTHHIRDNIRFESIEQLSEQLKRDKSTLLQKNVKNS